MALALPFASEGKDVKGFRVLGICGATHKVAEASGTSRRIKHVFINILSISLEAKDGATMTYHGVAEEVPEVTALKGGDIIMPAFVRDANGTICIGRIRMVGADGVFRDPASNEYGVRITNIHVRPDGMKVMKTRNSGTYEINQEAHPWHKYLRVGTVARFSYLPYAVQIKKGQVKGKDFVVYEVRRRIFRASISGRSYRDLHTDPIVVTRIIKRQHHWRLMTNFSNIVYDVDVNEAYDVKFQRIGERPAFNYRILMPAGNAMSVPRFGVFQMGGSDVNVTVSSDTNVVNSNLSNNENNNVSDIESDIQNHNAIDSNVEGSNSTNLHGDR
jgi:hypothetical protein